MVLTHEQLENSLINISKIQDNDKLYWDKRTRIMYIHSSGFGLGILRSSIRTIYGIDRYSILNKLEKIFEQAFNEPTLYAQISNALDGLETMLTTSYSNSFPQLNAFILSLSENLANKRELLEKVPSKDDELLEKVLSKDDELLEKVPSKDIDTEEMQLLETPPHPLLILHECIEPQTTMGTDSAMLTEDEPVPTEHQPQNVIVKEDPVPTEHQPQNVIVKEDPVPTEHQPQNVIVKEHQNVIDDEDLDERYTYMDTFGIQIPYPTGIGYSVGEVIIFTTLLGIMVVAMKNCD